MKTMEQNQQSVNKRILGSKRLIAFVLLVCMLLPLLTACGGDRGDGTAVCRQFIQYITTENYEGAYSLLLPELRDMSSPATPKPTPLPSGMPTQEPTPLPTPTTIPSPTPINMEKKGDKMTLSQFRTRYTSIYEAMDLTEIAYSIVSEASGSITASLNYDMTYYTNKAGNLSYRFTVHAVYQQGSWYIDWSPALIFPDMEWGDTVLSGINYPRRGEIFDCEGRILAQNVNAVTVFCIPSNIDLGEHKPVTDVKALFKANDESLSAAQLEEKSWYVPFEKAIAAIPELKKTEEDVRNAFARTYQNFTKIATLYPDQFTTELEERLLAIKGIGIDTGNYGTVRYYPYGESLCHLIGYAGIIQKEYIQEYDDKTGEKNEEFLNDPFYDGDSWLGYAGLEKQYENILRGEKGSFAYIQGKGGQNKQILYNIPAVNGQDLHLTVDIALQQRMEQVVKNVVYDSNITGAVLILNPKTGALQSSLSFPGYDPNAFSRGDLDEDAWDAMQKDPQEPLFNRVIQGLYPPGSTFKPLTAISLLESGTLNTEDFFPAEEEGLRGEHTVWNPSKSPTMAYTGVTKVTRTLSTNRRMPMNMHNCMVQSDNIYFAWGAMKLGWEALIKYLSIMGMGESIPFELTTQKSQIINEDTDQTYDLLAMTGYGQGELLVTPLQMASYIGAFQNEGQVAEPYLIDSIWHQKGMEYNLVSQHEQKTWKTICSPVTAAAINNMLKGVVELPSTLGGQGFGTGRFLGIRRVYTCAGKTGTAELDKKQGASEAAREIAWFICYRTCERETGLPLNPQDERLVMVLLEVDMTKQAPEWTQMKFLIAQALLKQDELTEKPVTENIMSSLPTNQ